MQDDSRLAVELLHETSGTQIKKLQATVANLQAAAAGNEIAPSAPGELTFCFVMFYFV